MEIKNLKPRLYQEKIFYSATKKNALVILPTGLGKTLIALMLSAHRLKKIPNSKILFLAPTKPLCIQHYKTFLKNTKTKNVLSLLTGKTKPEERKIIWEDSSIIFATPQTITNDLISGRINLEDVSLIIFDEAHRAVGEYDYVFLAKHYKNQAKDFRILALTASPGSNKEEINIICKNLFVDSIEIRHEKSPDVSPYVEKRELTKIFIELPEDFKELKVLFEGALKRRLVELKNKGLIESSDITKIRKGELLKLQSTVASEANQTRNYEQMKNVSTIAACIKTMHCLELLQAQGVRTLSKFIEKLKKQYYKVKATKDLMNDVDFREAMSIIFRMESGGIEHPKFKKLFEMVNPDSKTIVFTNYRNTISMIVETLKEKDGIVPMKFIGQKEGMNQKRQIETIERFKDGKFNVLVSSSIGEEGLDIPEVDRVIFFEPIPSALRTIQRMGRTARHSPGEVILFITKDTIDEKYYWVSFHKERRMKNALEEMKEVISNPQRRIEDFGK